MESPKNIPNRLVFSAHYPKRRKRAFIIVLILGLVQLCLIWPIYPLFGSATPLILGFPLSFAWVILMVICSFSTLLWFFLSEQKEQDS